MATYPTFMQIDGSMPISYDDVAADRAVNGDVRQRAFYAGRKLGWKLRHLLWKEDLATLLAFYDAHRLANNTFVWQRTGTSYSFRFAGPPTETPVGGGYTDVQVTLLSP